MINLEVAKKYTYKELKIEGINSQITTGLLDEIEALNIARQLINAAENLLSSDYDEQKMALALIRNYL